MPSVFAVQYVRSAKPETYYVGTCFVRTANHRSWATIIQYTAGVLAKTRPSLKNEPQKVAEVANVILVNSILLCFKSGVVQYVNCSTVVSSSIRGLLCLYPCVSTGLGGNKAGPWPGLGPSPLLAVLAQSKALF